MSGLVPGISSDRVFPRTVMRGLDPRIHISQARHAPAKPVDGRTNPITRAREHGGLKQHLITKVGFGGALISCGIRRDWVGFSGIKWD